MMKQIRILGIIGLIILYVAYVSAMTGTTHQFIAQQAFSNLITEGTCEGTTTQMKLLEGAVAPDDQNFYSSYPEFNFANHHCENNDANCSARVIAKDWGMKAKAETDQCKRAFEMGVMSHFLVDAGTPAHWYSLESDCHSNFEQQIEDEITLFAENWNVSIPCTTKDTDQSVQLNFSQDDLNRMIANLIVSWNETNIAPPTYQVVAQQQDVMEILRNIVEGTGDANYDIEKIKVEYEILKKTFYLGCYYTTERREDFYAKWKNLDNLGKSCLQTFISEQQTEPYAFSKECSLLSYDPAGAWYARNLLDQYVRFGFAEERCKTMQYYTPTFIGQESSTGMQQVSVCYYYPIKLGSGCLEEFNANEKRTGEAWENGGLIIGLLIIGILVVCFIVIWIIEGAG